jgi:hypothetical protein
MPTPTIFWNVDADGDWGTSADWSLGRLPTSADDVAIDTTDLHTVTHSAGTDTVHTLTVGNDDFTVSGGSLTIASTSSFANLLTVSGGTLELDGDATVANFIQGAGTVSGAGTLVLDGGIYVLNSGATLTTSAWSILGGTVQVNENLTYTGAFSTFKYGFLSVSVAQGDTLTLTDAVRVAMPKHSSGWRNGTIQLANATLSHDVVIGGTATLSDIGSMDQTGEVTIGDKGHRPGSAILSIAAGAVYRLDTHYGIFAYGRVSDHAPSIINNGLLIMTAGKHQECYIDATIMNNGIIEAADGQLDLRAVVGGGSMVADPRATLAVDASAAAGLNMRFNGGDATLDVGGGAGFAATINDFSPTDTILLLAAADAATLGPGDALVVTNAGAAVATLQLAGDYAAATFNVTPDRFGGVDITVTMPGGAHEGFIAGHRFVAAMAGLAGSSGGTIHADHATPVHEPMLFKPRAMIA